MAMQYITHNLGVIAEMADDVVVMYLGKVVEYGRRRRRSSTTRSHPYTQALLRSIPQLGRKSHERLESIKGMVPDPYRIPSGCAVPSALPELSARASATTRAYVDRAGAGITWVLLQPARR